MTTNGSKPSQNGSGKKAPLLLFTAFPADGHFNPVFILAAYMKQRGYEVVFVTSPMFKAKIESIGAEYIEMDEVLTPEGIAGLMESAKLPFGIERLKEEFRHVFISTMPTKIQQLEEAMVQVHARDPERQIIFVEDVPNWGLYPYKHGRPLPAGWTELPKSIGVGLTPLLIDGVDSAPILMGLPPDSTPSGKLRNAALLKLFREGPLKVLIDCWVGGMEKVGSTDMEGAWAEGIFNSWYTAHDAVAQLCSPSMDYERSDMPPAIEFIGVLAGSPPPADLVYPSWWSDVAEAKKDGKNTRVVFVTQGTTNPDVSELILPTINALADRDDVLVVATLGMRGVSLPEGTTLPANARVIDYFPYDVVLEHADIFVTNAGYGSFGHAVRKGVPMVLAGQAQEKFEVAMRAAWAGLGVNLKTQHPTVEQVRDGVDQVLADLRFKKAAVGLKAENEKLDALAAFERKVKELIL
jgi:UDP:flavonoid glycosyltransferase YjiC (YdhE family)